MIHGIGTDIIEIHRIEKALKRFGERFLKRIYTDKEIAYCTKYTQSASHFAVRFAGKEAVIKALNLPISLEWKDISILNHRDGKPYVEFSDRLMYSIGAQNEVLITLSHSREFATATALFLSKD